MARQNPHGSVECAHQQSKLKPNNYKLTNLTKVSFFSFFTGICQIILNIFLVRCYNDNRQVQLTDSITCRSV